MDCPNCLRKMVYRGNDLYECLNLQCSILEVKINKFDNSMRVKRVAQYNGFKVKPYVEGICSECGALIQRPRPCDVGVCTNNGHKPVLVELT